MNARPLDAAEGYRLYRLTQGEATLDEINDHLRGISLRPVSRRMLVHYQRLYRHGYESYIPINRLDIALAGEDAWSEELHARYPELSVATPAEAIWNLQSHPVLVESLGVSTATIISEVVPSAGTPVVLKLRASGIERSGSVIRSEKRAGRFHVAFDPYTSVPLAPPDSAVRAQIRFTIPEPALNLSAITDIFLATDRFLVLADPHREHLVRVRAVSLNSPLELVVQGADTLIPVLAVAWLVVQIRKKWYEGTEAKYRAQGIQIDNEQRRAAIQKEADAMLKRQLEEEVELDADDVEILTDLAQPPHLPLGDPGTPQRRRLSDIGRAALELPPETAITVEDSSENARPRSGS